MPTETQPGHIPIPGDTLIPDREFRDLVLLGACPRTGRKLDAKGLPFVMISGKKYRPLAEGREWLKGQIVRGPATPDNAAA